MVALGPLMKLIKVCSIPGNIFLFHLRSFICKNIFPIDLVIMHAPVLKQEFAYAWLYKCLDISQIHSNSVNL